MDIDLHAHLYGYLTSSDVYELGQSRWRKRMDRLSWYEREYMQAWGRQPQWQNYWLKSHEGLLKEDFLFTSPGSFSRFQSCFNLMIAVLPAVFDASAVARCVLERIEQEKYLSHVELRMPLPPGVSEQQAESYLNDLLREFARVVSQNFTPTLAISLPRDHRYLKKQYEWIKNWQKSADSTLKKYLTGIDFCGAEEEWPPHEKKRFLDQVHKDNDDTQNALAILYHVGETSLTLSPHSSVRRIAEASLIGVHRMGHATYLGLNPQSLPLKMLESYKEWRFHLLWLLKNQTLLMEHGYFFSRKDILKELHEIAYLPGFFEKVYDKKVKEDLNRFQNAVFSLIRKNQTVIETCLTSNMMLGGIASLAHHPITRFIDEDVLLCLGSDDPGIFATSFQEEKEKCLKAGIQNCDLLKLKDEAKKMKSSSLVGRFL
ncbi:MAG: hypothetical protein AB8C84_05780 [Oligoflexales bacterium]